MSGKSTCSGRNWRRNTVGPRRSETAHLAVQDTAATQLSLLEMERLNLQIRLLESRANNLEIKSPIDGVVIHGEPRKLEGARLTIGQTLLEVGPLDPMLVEIAVPDEDIAHAQVGQQVLIRLEAQPTRRYTGRVARIHPRAVPQDQANVFLAEVSLRTRMAPCDRVCRDAPASGRRDTPWDGTFSTRHGSESLSA